MVYRKTILNSDGILYARLLDRRHYFIDTVDTFGLRQRRMLALGDEKWVTRTN